MESTEAGGPFGLRLSEGLCSTAQDVERFIDPTWIKTSDWPANIIPAGAIAIDRASENGDCTVKGFYDPATGEFHIQEVLHNVAGNRLARQGQSELTGVLGPNVEN